MIIIHRLWVHPLKYQVGDFSPFGSMTITLSSNLFITSKALNPLASILVLRPMTSWITKRCQTSARSRYFTKQKKGQRDDLAGKGIWGQAWWLQFKPWDPRPCGRRELSPKTALWPPHPCCGACAVHHAESCKCPSNNKENIVNKRLGTELGGKPSVFLSKVCSLAR